MFEDILAQLQAMNVAADTKTAPESPLDPEFDSFVAQYKRIEQLLKQLKPFIEAKVAEAFSQNDKLAKFIGDEVAVTRSLRHLRKIVGDPDLDPILRQFVKVEVKPDGEKIDAYLEATNALPAGIVEEVSTSYLIKLRTK